MGLDPWIFIFAAHAASPAEPDGHWVGGYYANWSYWRGGGSIKSLDTIANKAGAANFIDYAFLTVVTSEDLTHGISTYGKASDRGKLPVANITAASLKAAYKDGAVIDIEQVADGCTAGDPSNWCAANKVYKYLEQYKENAGNKPILMASIGGWSYTKRFSEMYQDSKTNPNVLTDFVNSVKVWLTQHPQFSGIDIDWEYPNYGHGGTPGGEHAGEAKFYTDMISQLHDMLSKLDTSTNNYYLTTAVVASAEKAKGEGVDWAKINKDVDWFNLMAFDLHGEFDAAPGGSGLAQAMDDPDAIDAVIEYYHNAGVPYNKIVLGNPLYAREMLVKENPANHNSGYKGNLRYSGYDNFEKAFADKYYTCQDGIWNSTNPYCNFNDNPNVEAYYPAGGMVDFTGAYDYSCFLGVINGKKGQDATACPINTPMDPRGNVGAALPSGLTLVKNGGPMGNDSIAWIYGNEKNVNALFTGAPESKYPAYPVFTIDTQATVKYKIDNLINKYGLGGIWFWELSEDALTQPTYSLFKTACYDLGKSHKCLAASGPTPGKGVKPGPCKSGSKNCVALSNNANTQYFPTVSYQLTCDGGSSYDFSNMDSGCSSSGSTSCQKHVQVPASCTKFTVASTTAPIHGPVQCTGGNLTNSVLCNVNTTQCECA